MKRRPIPRGAIKIDLPNTTQVEDWTCGPSALLAICAYYGVGPAWEADVARDMRATTDGTDPVQIMRAARRYGLRVEEFRGMTTAQLVACVKRARPVIVMLQAWAGGAPNYAKRWSDGHWVVAIGFDRDGVYFEDPSLHASRGFLTYRELDVRWHDVEGKDNHHVERYGAAIWKPSVRGSAFARQAVAIE